MLWKLAQKSCQFSIRNAFSSKSFFSKTTLKNKFTVKVQDKATKYKITGLTKIGLGLTAGSVLTLSNLKITFCQPKNRSKDYDRIEEQHSSFDWGKFWLYLRPELLWFIAAIISALAVAIINIRIPQIMSDVINILVKFTDGSSNFYQQIKEPAIRLILLYVAQSAFTFLYIVLLAKIGETIANNMKCDLFKNIIAQDISFFDTHRTGEIVNRLTVDIQDFKSSFKQTISGGLRSITQIVGSGVTLYMISPYLAVLTVLTIPTVIIIGSGFGVILRKLSRKAQGQTEKTTLVAEEAISNIRTVRAFAMEDQEIEIFYTECGLIKSLNIALGVGIGVFQAGTNLFLNGMVLGTLSCGGYLLSTNQLTAGELMAFLMATQTIQRSLAQLSLLFGAVIRGISAGTRVFEFINLKPKVELKGGIIVPINEIKGKVEFKDVTFAYPSRKDQIVVKSLNLSINPGQTVALVGSSGNGKSTVIALLERLYDVDSGSITLDGRDLRSLDPTFLRQQLIGYVSQEPILFGCSIRENIRYGKPTATEEEIIAAARLANAHDFITGFSSGYDTLVGERGSALSGGQKQRIAIARALLKNPPILILDEATSALDSESEHVVQSALNKAQVGRTCLVIAHRLSTVQNADLIVVLDKGRVVEKGTAAELMKLKGIYWLLALQQQIHEKDDRTNG